MSSVPAISRGMFAALPTDEHIVFDNTLFVPPMGSKNRKIEGELGKFRLNLGDGYLLHGTPYKESIGLAATEIGVENDPQLAACPGDETRSPGTGLLN